jgi:superfamily I DNA and/or RNA helicase
LRGKIGIISPYKEQVNLIKRTISKIGSVIKLGTHSNEDGIEVNTVDAF